VPVEYVGTLFHVRNRQFGKLLWAGPRWICLQQLELNGVFGRVLSEIAGAGDGLILPPQEGEPA
jgi:hypothetical protein